MRTVLHNGVICFPIPHLIFLGQRYSLFVLKLRMKGKLIERHILYCITEHLIYFFFFFFWQDRRWENSLLFGGFSFQVQNQNIGIITYFII